MPETTAPLVGIVIGSKADWETMQQAANVLVQFGVPHECRVLSAQRTPVLTADYAKAAAGRGIEVIIAGAGGATHLAAVVASFTMLPVLGVPIQSKSLQGIDSLLAMVQMPGGVPVGTLAIGDAGAKNAGLFAVRMLANSRPELRQKLADYHTDMAAKVARETLP